MSKLNFIVVSVDHHHHHHQWLVPPYGRRILTTTLRDCILDQIRPTIPISGQSGTLYKSPICERTNEIRPSRWVPSSAPLSKNFLLHHNGLQDDSQRSTLISSNTDWLVRFAVRSIRTIRLQHHVSNEFILFLSSWWSVHISALYRKIKNTRVRTSLIFVCLVIAQSLHILFSFTIAFLAICTFLFTYFSQPTLLSTLGPRYVRLETTSTPAISATSGLLFLGRSIIVISVLDRSIYSPNVRPTASSLFSKFSISSTPGY